MAKIHFTDVGIKAVAACVPKNVQHTSELSYLLSEKEIQNLENIVGIKSKRIADENICSSDMCFEAAKVLFEDNNIEPSSIDVLLFMSKTPDYIVPTTSTVLQEKLGLSKHAVCMDLRGGCAGYIQALSIAYMYASMPEINRVLILNGDTLTKIVSKNDKATTPIFGDGGAATIVEKGDYGESWFEMGSDGKEAKAIIVPASVAGRNNVTPESFTEKTDENGNSRNALQIEMNGMNVFSFAISAVPKSIKKTLEYAGKQSEDIDLWLIHQANEFIIKTIVKKMKIVPEKVPVNIDRFANTTHVSIPLLLASERGGKIVNARTLMTGFGSGLAWASAIVNLQNTKISKLIEL